jgi:hypothetical protein
MVRLISNRPFDAGLKGVIVMGPAALVFVGAFHLDSWGGVATVVLSAAASVVVAGLAGARISAGRGRVRLSIVPFWTLRLHQNDIESVTAEKVRPLEDFGGWGIKGRSRKKGLLFSSGGDEVVVFRTRSGRTYLVSVREGEGARVAAELGRVNPAREGATA